MVNQEKFTDNFNNSFRKSCEDFIKSLDEKYEYTEIGIFEDGETQAQTPGMRINGCRQLAQIDLKNFSWDLSENDKKWEAANYEMAAQLLVEQSHDADHFYEKLQEREKENEYQKKWELEEIRDRQILTHTHAYA